MSSFNPFKRGTHGNSRHPKTKKIGKAETENMGIEKVIKNTVTSHTIRFLPLVGRDPEGHHSGRTLLSLWKDGVDEGVVIIPQPEKRIITMEHYSYDNRRQRYQKHMHEHYRERWVTQLSHAAYLGRELVKAELSLKLGSQRYWCMSGDG